MRKKTSPLRSIDAVNLGLAVFAAVLSVCTFFFTYLQPAKPEGHFNALGVHAEKESNKGFYYFVTLDLTNDGARSFPVDDLLLRTTDTSNKYVSVFSAITFMKPALPIIGYKNTHDADYIDSAFAPFLVPAHGEVIKNIMFAGISKNPTYYFGDPLFVEILARSARNTHVIASGHIARAAFLDHGKTALMGTAEAYAWQFKECQSQCPTPVPGSTSDETLNIP